MGDTVRKDQLDQISSEAQKKSGALQLSVEAEVNLARSELERSRITLRNYSSVRERGNIVEVKSPVSGAAFRIYRESEGAANVGEPLMDLGNSRDLEVRVEVLSPDAVKIQKGTAVLFKRWGKENR